MSDTVNPQEVKLWFALVGRGCVGAVIGMILMADPWAPHGRTTGLFLAYLLADCALGVYALARALPRVVGAQPHIRRGPLVLISVVDAVAAVLVAVFPATLPVRLIGGIRAIVTGVSDVRWSNRHDISALVMLGGIAAVGLGVLLAAWPGPGTVALPWLLGLQTMVSGSLFLAGALSELRRVATTAVPQAA